MDIQQISIASLIIALGLLVDDPVVAGDAIKRELAAGTRATIAAWLGPTKLATAILYATITNIVAYLPFLILTGSTGQFIYSLPVVMTCSLVASRLVSWTFIPLLGFYLLRGRGEPSIEEAERREGFGAAYYRLGRWAIAHRWLVMAGAAGVLVLGGLIGGTLKPQFFPKDLSQLAFIDVLLPEDASFSSTSDVVAQVEKIAAEVSAAKKMPIEAMSSFVGGGGPRFWYSLSPEAPHPNYAQVVLVIERQAPHASPVAVHAGADESGDCRRPDRRAPVRDRRFRRPASRDPHFGRGSRLRCERSPNASRRHSKGSG